MGTLTIDLLVMSTHQNNEINDKKRVSFHTLGCRLNSTETSSLAQGFVERGYQVVPFAEDPNCDLSFINTCTVTDHADSTCRNLIRRAHRKSPKSKIVVAGCYAQMKPEEVARIPGVDLVLGSHEKQRVFEYLEKEEDRTIHVDRTNEFWGAHTSLYSGQTKGFLKIQDGCNYICSFCIIPFARSRSRCQSIDDTVAGARDLTEKGFSEVILTGVNIGEYVDPVRTERNLLHHMIEDLSEVPHLKRLRLSSVEPNTITPELLAALKKHPAFLPHFHIPLQSGSDATLKAMRRKYTRAQYAAKIHSIVEAFPGATIGADIMCGFPGETDEHFEETMDLLRTLPVTHFHVFPYSRRHGTTADKREDHITAQLKKERSNKLIDLGEQKLAALMNSLVGAKLEVLFESSSKQPGHQVGHAPQFVKVQVKSSESLKGVTKKVKIDSVDLEKNVLLGSILD